MAILGFEFTLPDFLGGEPAPAVSTDPLHAEEPIAGQVVSLPSPFGLGTLIQFLSLQICMPPEAVQALCLGCSKESICDCPRVPLGIDPSPPILPPPEASQFVIL